MSDPLGQTTITAQLVGGPMDGQLKHIYAGVEVVQLYSASGSDGLHLRLRTHVYRFAGWSKSGAIYQYEGANSDDTEG